MREKLNTVKRVLDGEPLKLVLVVAILFRLLAGLFSIGYPFHDDHFLAVTPAQHWVYGFNYWLDEELPPSRTLLYPGIFYGIFSFLDGIGLTDPVFKSKLMQVLHGAWSLLTVVYTFRIVELISTKRTAAQAAMIMAILWFWPSMSVKFLIEMVVIPLILIAYYKMIRFRQTGEAAVSSYIIAGVLMGLAFIVLLLR